jgi:hypothetical protein
MNKIYLFITILLLMCISITASTKPRKIDAVLLTTGKDLRIFEKSLSSAMRYLIDIDKFYVVSPDSESIKKKLTPNSRGNMSLTYIFFIFLI